MDTGDMDTVDMGTGDMDTVVGPAIASLRCSPFHTSLNVDPIGSAGFYDAYLCVEVPMPWPRDISQSEPFASLCDPPSASITGSDGRRWRPQGLVSTGDSGELVSVTVWESRRGDGSTAPLTRRDWITSPERVGDLVRALVFDTNASRSASAEFDDSSVEHNTFKSAFYLCSHGQRDVCCGSMGTDLFKRVPPMEAVELRRCSHTGGHRFAATGISFPDGYAWAHLDADLVAAVARRSVPPGELAAHCRGNTLLPAGPAQVADRHALCELGWEWADSARSVELIGFERRTMTTDLRITGELPGGDTVSFEVSVTVEGHVPQITCGAISEPEYKVEPIWQVSGARQLL